MVLVTNWSLKMSTVGLILLIAFVVVSVLLILLVLVQDDGKNGMGGLLGGRGTAAFGSHSASVLTKATAVFVVLFFVLAFFLALLNKKPANPNLDAAVTETAVPLEETSTENASENGEAWWGGETSSSESVEKATVTE